MVILLIAYCHVHMYSFSISTVMYSLGYISIIAGISTYIQYLVHLGSLDHMNNTEECVFLVPLLVRRY